MRPLLLSVVVALFALIGGAATAHSQSQSYSGIAWVGIKGWGGVNLAKGIEHGPLGCTHPSCPPVGYLIHGPRIVLIEKAYQGWKFTGWHGACKGTQPKCVINVARLHRNSFGQRNAKVGVRFIPVAAGLTRGHPIPLGTAAGIGQGPVAKVNSANANVQLSQPPPAGLEYFDANLTVTYTGVGSEDPGNFGFSVEGSNNTPAYTTDRNGCPSPGPQPPLDTNDPLYSGQSATGYVCWRIDANDASSLELLFGAGTPASGTTWFALH